MTRNTLLRASTCMDGDWLVVRRALSGQWGLELGYILVDEYRADNRDEATGRGDPPKFSMSFLLA